MQFLTLFHPANTLHWVVTPTCINQASFWSSLLCDCNWMKNKR
ncbi:hypothetical protein YPPY34_4535 [Yersinia pestis PY-34]|nr:hypothetical protein YPPY34_4535 [Yersinia pestis PY-34]